MSRLSRRLFLGHAAVLSLASCQAGRIGELPTRDGGGPGDSDGGSPDDGGIARDAGASTTDAGSGSIIDDRFGTGTDAGHFAADVWSPGRDATGQVNAVSWQLVPVGRWVEVEGTALQSIEPQVKAAVPAWRDWGTEGWGGVTNDWNGFAIDTKGNRLWLFGGGHSGSSNNGIYRFDAMRMKWAIEDLPSDPTPWSTDYKMTGARGGTYTGCAESAEVYNAAVAAGTLQTINGPYSDELFWDKKPTSRHTYSSMVFVPESNELVMVCRRLWRYSLTEHRWTYKRLIRDLTTAYLDGENMVTLYDEVRGEVLVSAAGSSGIYNATGYSLATNQWVDWGSPWNLYSTVADVRVGRREVIVTPATKPGGGYGANPGRYWNYDLDGRQLISSGEMTMLEGLTTDGFPPSDLFYDSPALAYIPHSDRYWLFTLDGTRQMSLFEINPNTVPWSIRVMPPMLGKVPNPGRNLERKMVLLPTLNAVLLCDDAGKNFSLYRLS